MSLFFHLWERISSCLNFFNDVFTFTKYERMLLRMSVCVLPVLLVYLAKADMSLASSLYLPPLSLLLSFFPRD